MTEDRIRIQGLKLETTVGVPDDERTRPQTIAVDLTIEPEGPLAGLDDKIENTIDYFEIVQVLKKVAGSGERKLIETLAKDLAATVLEFDRIRAVTLEIRKFILPETDFVSVSIRRERTEL